MTVIFNPAWFKVLVALNNLRCNQHDRNVNIRMVEISTGILYGHVKVILNEMKNMGWVTVERKGRESIIKLTDDGKDLVPSVKKIFSAVSGGDEDA